MLRRFILCTALLLGLGLYALNQTHPTVFLVGDSTVSNFAERYAPMAGWGATFQGFFSSELTVDNRAIAGKSSRSFIEEGKWSRVLKDIKKGDYLFIQFGHNDQKKDYRYTDPYGTYQDFLTQYIQDTRRQGGIPILVTSVMRRRFRDGNLYDTHGDYPKAVRQLAEELDVPLIDLHARSFEYFDDLGPEATKDIFLWLKPGEASNYPKGLEDNTHFSEYGARQVGQLVVDGLKDLDLPLKDYLKDCRKEIKETLTICAGDSVYLDGKFRKQPGVYRISSGTEDVCPTTRVVTLAVKATSSSTRTVTLCAGESISIGGRERRIPGTYFETFSNQHGCDSVVTTRLRINPTQETKQSLTICAGDSVWVGDRFARADGRYRHTYQNRLGCDSTVVTNLKMMPSYSQKQSITLAEGDSTRVGRRYYHQAGTYYDVLQSVFGCDSVIATVVSVIPRPDPTPSVSTERTVALCAGDSLWIGGTYQRTAGVFYDTLTTALGRDSVIVTKLIVANPVAIPIVEAASSALRSSVAGDAYRWFFNGEVLEDTNATLVASSEGSYAVSVRIGSCYSSLSDAYYHVPTDTSIITDLPNTEATAQPLRVYQSERNYLTVDTSETELGPAALCIHNLLGRQIWQDDHYRSLGMGRIFFGSQPTGIYVATLIASGRRTTVKFHWNR